jgi:hypothetical protein
MIHPIAFQLAQSNITNTYIATMATQPPADLLPSVDEGFEWRMYAPIYHIGIAETMDPTSNAASTHTINDEPQENNSSDKFHNTINASREQGGICGRHAKASKGRKRIVIYRIDPRKILKNHHTNSKSDAISLPAH